MTDSAFARERDRRTQTATPEPTPAELRLRDRDKTKVLHRLQMSRDALCAANGSASYRAGVDAMLAAAEDIVEAAGQ
jgi:hypothetical protein